MVYTLDFSSEHGVANEICENELNPIPYGLRLPLLPRLKSQKMVGWGLISGYTIRVV